MFDWTFISHYAPFFVSGAEMTLFISVFGIILAIVVGLVCAGIEIARIPVLRQVVRVYIAQKRKIEKSSARGALAVMPRKVSATGNCA